MPDENAVADAEVDEIAALLAKNRTPDFAKYDNGNWRRAVNMLLERGEFEPARLGARLMLRCGLQTAASQTLCRVLDVLPPESPRSKFPDNPEREVQVAPRAGSETAVLIFSGINRRIGVPFVVGHRWFGRLDASVVYLRDISDQFFVGGIPSLGPSRADTVAALRQLLAGLGAKRVVCLGNSIGGFAALQYGIDLGAEAVVSMAGPTDLSILRSSWAKGLSLPPIETDLRLRLSEAERPPQVLAICADGNWDDRIRTGHIADLPSVQQRMVERYNGHSVITEIICREQFDGVLDWMMTATPEKPRDIGPFPWTPWRDAVK